MSHAYNPVLNLVPADFSSEFELMDQAARIENSLQTAATHAGQVVSLSTALGHVALSIQAEMEGLQQSGFFQAEHISQSKVDGVLNVLRHSQTALGHFAEEMKVFQGDLERQVDAHNRIIHGAMFRAHALSGRVRSSDREASKRLGYVRNFLDAQADRVLKTENKVRRIALGLGKPVGLEIAPVFHALRQAL